MQKETRHVVVGPEVDKARKLTRAPGSGMIGGRRPVNAPRMTPADLEI